MDEELNRRLFALETNVVGMVKVTREITASLALIVATMRTGQPMEEAELDEMLKSLDELHALLARVSEFLPDVGD